MILMDYESHIFSTYSKYIIKHSLSFSCSLNHCSTTFKQYKCIMNHINAPQSLAKVLNMISGSQEINKWSPTL